MNAARNSAEQPTGRDLPGAVLVLGGTGRTGGRVVRQLLDRGVPVRTIVRSSARLPGEVTGNRLLTVIEADLLALPQAEMQAHLEGCDAVISCLGHTITARGILGPPRDLVERAVRNVSGAAAAMRPARPIRVVLMSSVSVNRTGRVDARRGWGERAFLSGLRVVVPPARDNQRAADFLDHEVGVADPSLEWVVVRPDTLTEGDLAEYTVHDHLVASLARPASTRMAQVADFMCQLALDPAPWQRWQGQMPVIVDAEPAPKR